MIAGDHTDDVRKSFINLGRWKLEISMTLKCLFKRKERRREIKKVGWE